MTNAERPDLLLDTSAAIALVIGDHRSHAAVLAHVDRKVLGLAGHAAFEAYSVLTRLPGPNRLSTVEATRAISLNFPRTLHLHPADAADLFESLARNNIAGGAVYDALVAATARVHDLPLVTRDQRAMVTYRAVGPEVQFVD